MSTPKTGSDVALDTNQAVALLNGDRDIGNWISQFATIYLPMPVIGELLFGAENSSRVQQNRDRVAKLLNVASVLDITLATANCYAKVRFSMKQAGRPIPSNDFWIAAVCVEHDVALATADAHFAFVPGLRVIKR